MAVADPTRAPAGPEVAWAYTHVPQHVRGDAGGQGIGGHWDDGDTRTFVERMEARVEAHAPGFRDLVIGRHVFTPAALEAADANLVGGDLIGGTSAIHQQLVFRPIAGLGRGRRPRQGAVPGVGVSASGWWRPRGVWRQRRPGRHRSRSLGRAAVATAPRVVTTAPCHPAHVAWKSFGDVRP